jgi:hypothetical protein
MATTRPQIEGCELASGTTVVPKRYNAFACTVEENGPSSGIKIRYLADRAQIRMPEGVIPQVKTFLTSG